MIECDFDVPFVADMALREKQIQQKLVGVPDGPPGDHLPNLADHGQYASKSTTASEFASASFELTPPANPPMSRWWSQAL
jgi:hypothetical protein